MSFNDIKNMPTAQKIHLMEVLWESLCAEGTEPKSPFWHKELLDIRAKKLKGGNVKTYTLDELKALRQTKVFKVVTTEFALDDLELGRAFYANKSIELGDYFFDSLITDIESLNFYAGIHIGEDGFYKMLSKRFPYSIY